MKITFLGDSITYGIGASTLDKCFFSLLKKRFPNVQFRNNGISGTRIARQFDLLSDYEERYEGDTYVFGLDFISRVPLIDQGTNVVFVFGGTNDFGHGSSQLGTINDATPFTFYGAVRCLLSELVEKYGVNNVKIILPLPRFDENDEYAFYNKSHCRKPLIYYSNAIEEVAKEFNVEFYDFRNNFMKPNSVFNNDLFLDGIHPNDEGHKLLADLVAEKIKDFYYE